MNRIVPFIFLLLFFSLLFSSIVCLQSVPADGGEQHKADAAAQANNPLANMTAFNIQNYYIGELTESDESANQFWLRFAKPISVADTNWIFRASAAHQYLSHGTRL